jgi:RNA polymerase sigma-70 factor, ECF subfamily
MLLEQTSNPTCDAMETELDSAGDQLGEPESHLIERFRAGDAESFTTLYRRHYAEVIRFAIYMTGEQSKAEELSQEVFVWLAEHANAYDAQFGTLPAFLKGVARNLLRRRWREERRWQSLDGMIVEQPAAKELIAHGREFTAAVDAVILRKAIAKLPLKYREAIVLCDLEGESYEDAAVVMQCPVGTVRSRLHRARLLLAKQFEPNNGRRQ